jgi:hypothetical protein
LALLLLMSLGWLIGPTMTRRPYGRQYRRDIREFLLIRERILNRNRMRSSQPDVEKGRPHNLM